MKAEDLAVPMELCPFCGEQVQPVEISSEAGVQRFSACCDAPLVILQNWEVYQGLPPDLQQMALSNAREEVRQIRARQHDLAESFKRTRDMLYEKYPHLFHVEEV